MANEKNQNGTPAVPPPAVKILEVTQDVTGNVAVNAMLPPAQLLPLLLGVTQAVAQQVNELLQKQQSGLQVYPAGAVPNLKAV